MQTTLQPMKKCGNPACQRLIPEGMVSLMLTFEGELREVCETCFDAWLSQVKTSKKQGRKRLQ